MPHSPTHVRAATFLAMLALSLLQGCADVAIWGNIFSTLLTLAIFVGTLSLAQTGGQPEGPLE